MTLQYCASDFSIQQLRAMKDASRVKIALVIPTLNESLSLPGILDIAIPLRDEERLLDIVAIVDSGSTDGTVQIAKNKSALVANGLAPVRGVPGIKGKGENLWKSLYFFDADIFVWVDADIINFHAGFVAGLLGPLLTNNSILYSTAFYRRPFGADHHGGGRVTELLVRPFLSMFFPEAAPIKQPMAGEHAGYRSLLEQVPFFTGYAVDVGLLINILMRFGDGIIAEVDCGTRLHRNRSLRELGQQAFSVLQALIVRASQAKRIQVHNESVEYVHFKDDDDYRNLVSQRLVEVERPALLELLASPEFYAK